MGKQGDALLKLAQQNPDIQINGEQLSAAVCNGSDTGHVADWWSVMDGLIPTEHDDQAALFAWAAVRRQEWPELSMLFAIPNGQYRAGQRPEPGLIAGVPDVALMVPEETLDLCMPDRDWYHGLFIELKRQGRQGHKNGGMSDAQLDWIERLRKYGYYVAICYGVVEAIDAIATYLGKDGER